MQPLQVFDRDTAWMIFILLIVQDCLVSLQLQDEGKLTISASNKIKIVAHINSDANGMELVVCNKSTPQTVYIARALATTNNEIVPRS